MDGTEAVIVFIQRQNDRIVEYRYKKDSKTFQDVVREKSTNETFLTTCQLPTTARPTLMTCKEFAMMKSFVHYCIWSLAKYGSDIFKAHSVQFLSLPQGVKPPDVRP